MKCARCAFGRHFGVFVVRGGKLYRCGNCSPGMKAELLPYNYKVKDSYDKISPTLYLTLMSYSRSLRCKKKITRYRKFACVSWLKTACEIKYSELQRMWLQKPFHCNQNHPSQLRNKVTSELFVFLAFFFF